MADWEDDDFEPAAPALKLKPVIKSQWADGDVEEDEPAKETKPEPAVEKPKASGKATPKKGKQAESKQPATRKKGRHAESKQTATAKKGKQAAKKGEQAESKRPVEVSDEVLSDPVAEKLR
ncbi:hypothetical protein LUZ60_017164 [Juncus effusus]|nr:hypothetical protein LUZ60_017164 [Juncus effusus]